MAIGKVLTFLSVAIGVIPLVGQARELLVNGAFEDDKGGKPVGWSVPKYWRLENHTGFNGTRCIVYDNPDDEAFYDYPRQEVPFEPGKRYSVTAWVKTEKLTKNIRLCVEWSDADGKFMGGTYVGSASGTCDWMQVQGTTPPIPSSAKHVRVITLVRKGGLGKAWFDNVSMKPLDRPVFGGLHSSAYRNISEDGKVKFLAAVNLKDHVGARVMFSYKDAGGTVRRVKPTGLGKHGAELEIEAAYLALGTNPVSCEIISVKGERIGGGSLDFTRVGKLPKRRTCFDLKRRTIVDGKPFFPIGMFLSTVGDLQLQHYLTGPFNCIMPYVAPDRKVLDKCRASGLEVIYPVNTIWSWHKRRPKGVDSDSDAQAYVERLVNSVKDHPAIMAWYCNDEIPVDRIPKLLDRQRLLERIDPDHPTWTVLCQPGEVRGYYQTFDVVGTDPYPIPFFSIGNVSSWTRTTDDEVFGLKPLWQVPQAFAWEDWNPKNYKDHRFPTREELINMTWQCVANGANGVVYWCYRLLYQKGGFRVDRWADICAAAASVKPYVTVILSEEDAPGVSCSNDELSVRAWRYQGNVYLAVVNNTRKRITGEVLLDTDFDGLVTLQGAKGCSSKGSRAVSVELEGLDVSFVRLSLPCTK